MKSYRLLYTVLLLYILAGCNKEEIVSNSSADGNELIASIEPFDAPSSRLGFINPTGYIFWHKYDKMDVTLNKDGKYSASSEFILNSASAGKTTGSFIGIKEPTERIGKYAAYPASATTFSEDGSELTIEYPSIYEYTKVDTQLPAQDNTTEELLTFGNCNPLMAGSIIGRTVKLQHLGGILCIDIVKMPCTEGTFTFTTDQKITGTATMTNGTWDNPGFKGVELAATPDKVLGSTVSIKFKNATKDKNGLFYIPVPAGTYSYVTVQIANNVGKVILENSFSRKIKIDRTSFRRYSLSENGVEVAKLKAAIANLESYKMEYDVNIINQNIEIPEGKIFTLDLNGNAITANNKYGDNVNVKGQLTLKDSKGYGQINVQQPYSAVYSNGVIAVNGENAHFIMQGGNINTKMSNPSEKGQFGVVLVDGADFTMTGGKIEAGWYAVSGNGNFKTQDTQINIEGGKLTSIADYAVYLPHQGTTNISGGTINGAAGAVSMNRGILNITGGTLKSDNTGITGEWSDGTGGQGNRVLHVLAKYGDCNVNINGGTFTAKGEQPALLVQPNGSNRGNVTINNGTFTGEVKCIPNANAQLIVNGGVFSDPTILNRLQPNAKVNVVLNKNYTGSGFSIKADDATGNNGNGDDATIDIDLNTHTWKLAESSSRARSNSNAQGFHFGKGTNGQTRITFKNGVLDATGVTGSVFNNFSQFALNGITVKGGANTDNIVSNQGGSCIISGSTITAAEGKHAIQSIGENTITVEGESEVNGNIDYKGTTAALNITGGTFNGNIEFGGTNASQLNINGGTFNGKLEVEAGKEGTAADCIKISGGDFKDADEEILKYTTDEAQPEDLFLTINEPIIIDDKWGSNPKLNGTLTVETTAAHSIECKKSVTVKNAVINTTNPKGKAVFHIANDNVKLTFDKTTVNHETSGDADGSDNSGLIVRVDKGNNISISLSNTTFKLNGEKGYQRAIVFPGTAQQTNCSIKMDNSHIIASTTTAMPNATYSMGLGYACTEAIKVDVINGSSIEGVYYAINHFANKGSATPDNAIINITDSKLIGWAAMNIHSGNNMNINIKGSELIGRNYYKQGSDDFGTIYFDNVQNHGTNCTINVENSTIESYIANTSIQNVMVFKNGWTANVNFKGTTTLKNTAVASGALYQYMILDQTGKQLNITGEDKVELKGKEGVQLVYKDPKF